MATTGTRTPLAKGPRQDQVGVSATVGGSQPADGRDMGATTATSDTAGAGGAQAAREGALQQRGKTQRAALLEQAEEAAAKLADLMDRLTETETSPLPREMCQEDRLRAATAILQMKETRASRRPSWEPGCEQWLWEYCGRENRKRTPSGSAGC